MKQRILHLRASNFVGGPEKQILAYASYDFGDQIESCIASFWGDQEGRELLRVAANRGIPTFALPASSVIGSLRALVHEIRNSNVRLICAHGYKPSVIAAIASRLTNIPYLCFLRGWTRENRKVALYEAVERLCARTADRVVCLSRTQASEAKGWVDESRVRVVVNAANRRDYKPEQRNELKREICALAAFDPSRPLVVAAGRLSPEKGMANLIPAAKRMQGTNPEIQFAIFGDGVERQRLQELVSSLGLDRSLHFVGHRTDFAELLAGADLLVNPSLTEQMPNVVLEAMSAGVPIVATAVGGVPELAQGGAIALVQPGDVDALSETITNLICTHSKCDLMVQNAWQCLREGFSLEKQAEQLKSLYSEFVGVRSEKSGSSLARISVILPVRNEEKRIASVLSALRNQGYPSELFEIVVADGMSTDSTAEVVKRYALQPGAPIRLIQNPAKLSSAGRNVGLANASGDVVLFVDGHSYIPNQNLLRNISCIFEETGADILCRPQPLDFPTNTFLQRAIAAARASWLGHGTDSTIYSSTREGWVDPSSAGAIYQRSLFDRFGGFDECFDACEDVEFNYRLHQAGMKAYIHPGLTVFYEPRKTLASLFGQMVRYGKGRMCLARKHPRSFSLTQLVPVAVILFAAFGLVAVFTPLRNVWLASMAVYIGIVLAESIRVSWRVGINSLLVLPATFVAIHTGLGAGLIVDAVSTQPSWTKRAAEVPSARSTSTRGANRANDSITGGPSVESRISQ